MKPSLQTHDPKSKPTVLKKKMMKKSRPFKPIPKRHEPQHQPLPSPQKQSPNYMKPTSSSAAKKEQLTPKDGKLSRTTSSLKRVRTLTKTPSFKPARAPLSGNKCLRRVVQRATCSSTLKDSKFPSYLTLNPGATESEGTSAMKVCPYNYCSLNGHHHSPAPPLKCFLSARRRLLKTQSIQNLEIDFPIEIHAEERQDSEDDIPKIDCLEDEDQLLPAEEGTSTELGSEVSNLDELFAEISGMEWEEAHDSSVQGDEVPENLQEETLELQGKSTSSGDDEDCNYEQENEVLNMDFMDVIDDEIVSAEDVTVEKQIHAGGGLLNLNGGVALSPPADSSSEKSVDHLGEECDLDEEAYNTLKRSMRSRSVSEESEELKKFNPREPNYLPVEPEPEGERVDLRHQEIDDRKNAEEWMLDYAIQRAVNKLAPVGKKKVSLLVAAFETVVPVPKYEPHMRRNTTGFALARPLQACH